MKLFLLLYADGTVIFAESQQELQQILKLFEHYCNIWKLKVNISKTKIVVFSKTKSNQIRVITKLPNSEQSYKGKVKTHNYINRQNQSTTGKL